jgi:PTH1 family peptidyl-tRNA hydrolase
VGQRVLDVIADRLRGKFERVADTHTAQVRWRGDTVYLVKPHAFMNVSGPPVRRALTRLGAEVVDLVLVYDDIDMELGKVRVRLRGSAGGHNGVKSVIDALGTDDIRRVKVGIGRPAHKHEVPDHVLTTFDSDEEPVMESAVATAADRVLELLARAR